MNKEVYFSVVIPLYNKYPHIKECIESILNQEYQNFEIIVVDDASTDNSLSVVKTFKDERVRIIKRTNSGAGGYAARNLGAKNAKYDWIAFLDADDLWMKNHLLKMKDAIQANYEFSIFSCSWSTYNPPNMIKNHEYYIKYNGLGDHLIDMRHYLRNIIENKRFTNSDVIVLKKTLYDRIGGFPENVIQKGGDLIFFLKILTLTKGYWVNNIGAIRNNDAVNMVTKTSFFNLPEMKKIFDSLILNNDGKNKKLLKQYYNQLAFKDAIQHIKREKRKIELYALVYNSILKQNLMVFIYHITPIHILYKYIMRRVKND